VVRVRGQVEVVDGDVAALPQELEGDCAADSCGAAGYGGGEAGEEGMGRHWGRCCEFVFFLFFLAMGVGSEV